jgi:hypothetical protein
MISIQNKMSEFIGSKVAINSGRLTIKIPNPEAPIIDAHNVPGGRGFSGGVQSSLGRARNIKNNPGPRSNVKYEPEL